MNHPLKVYNPAGGIHFLLQWWTHEEQNHIIVARSESAMQTAFNRICIEEKPDRVKCVLKVELVAPSEKLCQEAAVYSKQQNVKNFMNEMVREIEALSRRGKTIPSQFQICTTYTPSPSYLEECEELSEYDREYHMQCCNCYSKVILVGYTQESLYDKYSESWYQANPMWRRREDKRAVYSHARIAKDDEQIWVAGPDFGHHCGGVQLRNSPSDYPEGGALFYFSLIQELNIKPWQDQIDEIKAKIEEKKKASDLAWEKKRKAIELADEEKFVNIFNKE